MTHLAKARRVCITHRCGKWQVRNSRCADCAAQYDLERGTPEQRGYGPEHKKTRTTLMAELYRNERQGIPMLCWRCGEIITTKQQLDADHSKVTALEGGQADCLTHSSCNRGKRTPTPIALT